MSKETSVPSQSAELNVYISRPNGRPAKETTFREWVVNNQIGMKSTSPGLPPQPQHEVSILPPLPHQNKKMS